MARVSIDIKTALDSAGINKARESVGKLSDAVDKETSKMSQHFDRVGQKMQSIGKGMSLAVTAPIVAGLTAATKAAAEEQQEMAVLANTLKNNAEATDKSIAATERWITKTQNATGFADGQLRPALGKLVIAGRTVEQSQADMAVAMDIARSRGLDLESVTNAMAKAAQGNTGALGKLGIAVKGASGETLSYDQILKNAAGTMGGAAAAAADTAAGKAEILRNKMADAKETIGTALLPVMDKLTTAISSIAEKFNALSPETQDIIVKLALVAAAVGPVLLVGGKAITMFVDVGRGFKALSAIMAANPWVLLIAATVALVMIIIKNWDTIKEALGKAWDWLKDKAGAVWDGIKGAFKAGVNAVIGYLNFQISAVEKIINALVTAYNLIADIPGNPLDSIKKVTLARIPQLAEGGTILSPGAALVGERGPELLNLPRGAVVRPLEGSRGDVVISKGAVNVVVHNSAQTDPRELENAVRVGVDNALRQLIPAIRAR